MQSASKQPGTMQLMREHLVNHLRDHGLLFALTAVMVFFHLTTNGTLLWPANMTNLLLQNSYIVTVALSMLIVIVSGNIHLSVGAVMGFIGGGGWSGFRGASEHCHPESKFCAGAGLDRRSLYREGGVEVRRRGQDCRHVPDGRSDERRVDHGNRH